MTDTPEKHTVSVLISDEYGRSVWREADWPAEVRGGMVLSPRIGCSSLRLRHSAPGYRSDWHVAQEPVLIVVMRGRIQMILRDASTRDFGPGDAFIAADAVPDDEVYDEQLHGHRAEVVGDESFEAVHIKLDPAWAPPLQQP